MERKYQYRGSATVLLCQSAVSRCRLGSCKIILGVFRQKEYQQFRFKKAGRCRSKTFSGYKRRESRVQRHAAAAG